MGNSNMVSRNAYSLAVFGLIAALTLLLFFSCGGDFNTAERIINIDVPAALFNPANHADPGQRGPGIDLVSVSLTCKSGNSSVPYSASVALAELPPGQAYVSLPVTVSGRLVSISASASLGGSQVCAGEIVDIEDLDTQRFGNFTGFANLLAFKLDWLAGDQAAGNLRILPCPRSSASLVYDSGVTVGGNTDIATSLLSRQVAVQLTAAENDVGGSISYELYYALASENPSLYTTASFPNTYLAYPWDEWWSHEEVVGGGGKRIADINYVMARFSGGHVSGQADGNGDYGILMDLRSVSGADAGKWVLICAVLTRAGVSVPSSTICVEIR